MLLPTQGQIKLIYAPIHIGFDVCLDIGGWGVSPTGKSFRFVSCVRARGGCRVRSGQKDKVVRDRFPFSLFPTAAFPFSLSSS